MLPSLVCRRKGKGTGLLTGHGEGHNLTGVEGGWSQWLLSQGAQ